MPFPGHTLTIFNFLKITKHGTIIKIKLSNQRSYLKKSSDLNSSCNGVQFTGRQWEIYFKKKTMEIM